MDKYSGLCIGCFRSIEEITGWSAADDHKRATILTQVTQRQQSIKSTKEKVSTHNE